jgi:hypothetical protein
MGWACNRHGKLNIKLMLESKIEMLLKEMGCEDVVWAALTQDRTFVHFMKSYGS